MAHLVLGAYTGVFLVLSLAIEAVKIYAAVDAAIRPSAAYVAAGKQTKLVWVLLTVVSCALFGLGFLGIAGIIATIVYLVDVRPAVRDVTRGRGNEGWYR
jgi:Protein of unknown function (DUF2516)